MDDDNKPRLVPYVDDRNFLQRLEIPQHHIDRDRRTARLVKDYTNVRSEFGWWEDECISFTQSLSRQDIDYMVRYLLREIASTEHFNRRTIKELRALTPAQIWRSR
jgi:hypothetical protein